MENLHENNGNRNYSADSPQPEENQKAAASPLEKALLLASHGLSVFPCRETTVYRKRTDGTVEKDCDGKPSIKFKAKAPYISNGFHGASRDPVTISRWWASWPQALIGLPTGEVNGITVVDLDPEPEAGITLEKLHGSIGVVPPGCLVVATPSGGEHIYFGYTPGIKSAAARARKRRRYPQ